MQTVDRSDICWMFPDKLAKQSSFNLRKYPTDVAEIDCSGFSILAHFFQTYSFFILEFDGTRLGLYECKRVRQINKHKLGFNNKLVKMFGNSHLSTVYSTHSDFTLRKK